MFTLSYYYYYKISAYHNKIFLYLFKKRKKLLCYVHGTKNSKSLNSNKKASLLNSSRSPAVTELFANVNVNDKRVSRQKRAVNAFEPPVEKHRFHWSSVLDDPEIGVGFFSSLFPSLLFFSFHSSPSLRSVLVARSTEAQNDGNALFPPPPSRSFHLFRSRHRMPRGDELSLLPPLCSIPIPPLPRSLVDAHTLWQIRPLDESTRRYLDISTGTRLIRPGDVFIHRDRLFHFDEWRDAALRFQRSEHICNWPLSVKSTRKYADRELFVKVFFFYLLTMWILPFFFFFFSFFFCVL